MCRDPDIDIVDLGTRPAVRLPMVIEALRHGKHIYNSCPHAPVIPPSMLFRVICLRTAR